MLKIVHLPSSLFKQRNLVTANPSLSIFEFTYQPEGAVAQVTSASGLIGR